MTVALITGCSSGFGLHTAVHFARAGDTVIAGMRDPSRGSALATACRRDGLVVDVVPLDVTDGASVSTSVSHALETHGRIDVLVNNAGRGLSGAIEDTGDDQARALFDVNLFGPLRMIRSVLPAMRAQGAGVVVNVSSIAGRVSAPFAGVYSASKYALEAVSEALHYEVRPFGVRVAVVEPGVFATALRDNRDVADPEGSAYSGVRRRWEAARARLPGLEETAQASAVAAAVYEAATRPDHPLRRPVGADAELLATLRADLDDATFEQTVRTALDFWE